jgi:branched-chain amino acid transport system permease protein
MSYQGILIQFLSGMSVGMVIFLIAVGLSLIFGTLRILNMAHAVFYMLGAYLCFWITSVLPEMPGGFWIALILASLGVAALGGIVEAFVIRPIYAREALYQFLLTFGLILIFADIVKVTWGIEYHSVWTPWPLEGAVFILGMPFPMYNLFLIILGCMVFLGLSALLQKTKLGRTIRAVTYSREMASCLGVNVSSVYTVVFTLGCWLSGLGGGLMTPIVTVGPGMDMAVLIECFIIVVIGGLGSLPGAFLGSLIFGLVNAFGILVVPRLAIAISFMLMIVVLIVRPWGLLGRRE